MKSSPFISLFLVFFLTACQATVQLPSSTATLSPTDTPPPTSTATDTPTPTHTPEPSPTPVILPDVLYQSFSGVSVIHHDSFEYRMPGMIPLGWQSDEKYAIWITRENQLKANPADNGPWSGTTFYFSGEKIIPNRGVYFVFKYTGSTENFTLGLDNINPNGERVTGDYFRSVAMEMNNRNLLVYGNVNRNQINGSFQGNLKLQEDTWYKFIIAHNNKDDFIMKIWDPNDSSKQLTYLRNWQDFPNSYYFISWITAKRSLYIDDFTVFQFEEIVNQ